jgi:hypothetical protein
MRPSPVNKNVNTEIEGVTVLVAATGRQPVKIKQTEKP